VKGRDDDGERAARGWCAPIPWIARDRDHLCRFVRCRRRCSRREEDDAGDVDLASSEESQARPPKSKNPRTLVRRRSPPHLGLLWRKCRICDPGAAGDRSPIETSKTDMNCRYRNTEDTQSGACRSVEATSRRFDIFRCNSGLLYLMTCIFVACAISPHLMTWLSVHLHHARPPPVLPPDREVLRGSIFRSIRERNNRRSSAQRIRQFVPAALMAGLDDRIQSASATDPGFSVGYSTRAAAPIPRQDVWAAPTVSGTARSADPPSTKSVPRWGTRRRFRRAAQ